MKGDSKRIGDYKYMEMKFTVEQRQKISARQQQAASILQMGRMELDTFLSQAVLENPLLEYDETRKETYEEHDIVERIEWLEETDKQNIQYYKQDYANQEGDIFASVGTEENEGLEEYLFSQFYTYPLDEKQKDVLEYLILSLDERGYFTESVEETAEVLKTQKKMYFYHLPESHRKRRFSEESGKQKICLLMRICPIPLICGPRRII